MKNTKKTYVDAITKLFRAINPLAADLAVVVDTYTVALQTKTKYHRARLSCGIPGGVYFSDARPTALEALQDLAQRLRKNSRRTVRQLEDALKQTAGLDDGTEGPCPIPTKTTKKRSSAST